jgi:hypothetical protein
MSDIKAPSVNISFIEKAISAITRGNRGIVVVAIKEETPIAVTTVTSAADIPSGLSDFNTEQIKFALVGYSNAPLKVIVYCMDADEEKLDDEYTKMMKYLETAVWTYLAIPTVETDGKTEDIASWIKSCRTTKKKLFKAVLPNSASDCEGIINVPSSLFIGDTEYTPEQACARVAGLIAGTAITISATYASLTDFDDCTRLTPDEEDAAVSAGKFVFTNDGEKVKVVRAVNSFVTTTDTKGDQFKKIKIVEVMDMISDDIRTTAQDSYLGKYVNSYDNKCLLITAINGYLDSLATQGILSGGSVEIDVDAQKAYFKEKGGIVKLEDGTEKALDECTDDEIKRANTGTFVFLTGTLSILDAIEDIKLPIYI